MNNAKAMCFLVKKEKLLLKYKENGAKLNMLWKEKKLIVTQCLMKNIWRLR